MTYSFQQATKENIKLRMALYGPPGCGKTYTALQLATILGKKIGLIAAILIMKILSLSGGNY
ncbi:AAA family ATPase [Pseudanabaena sp. 'Roaring Creek']|uniref:AAA family ATPase n=1 Tax=Pseudanabaena sp. 'Roaring Creek' TaxID=1681830 RepID=UPI0006D77810|nr:AAA family ATPase [Pseudanabaena sp. 'Roaring Creek']